jgi:hypothetical protein
VVIDVAKLFAQIGLNCNPPNLASQVAMSHHTWLSFLRIKLLG